MEDLNKIKLIEEIKSIRYERIVNILKGLSILLGTIVLFIAIQRPESILNRKLSSETINRERAKLLLEIRQKNDNAKDILFDLAIVEKAYPSENNVWIQEVKNLYETKLEKQKNLEQLKRNQNDLQFELVKLREELQEQLKKKELLQYALISEVNTSSKKGIGPKAIEISKYITNVETVINDLRIRINSILSKKAIVDSTSMELNF